jgi:hypothetical protein
MVRVEDDKDVVENDEDRLGDRKVGNKNDFGIGMMVMSTTTPTTVTTVVAVAATKYMTMLRNQS